MKSTSLRLLCIADVQHIQFAQTSFTKFENLQRNNKQKLFESKHICPCQYLVFYNKRASCIRRWNNIIWTILSH